MKNLKTVWCEGAIGFSHCGDVFKARVLDNAEMHRPARDGYVWVERITTPADPEVEIDENGNKVPWRVEWPRVGLDPDSQPVVLETNPNLDFEVESTREYTPLDPMCMV